MSKGKEIRKRYETSMSRQGYGRIAKNDPWLNTAVKAGTATGVSLVLMVLTGVLSIGFLYSLFATLFVLGVVTTLGSGGMVAKKIYIDKKKN